jgi:hypothetical protein
VAKSQSLAAQAGALANPLTLPAVFTEPQSPVKARFIAPYVVFAHSKRADEFAKIVAKLGSCQEGQMYLVEPERVTFMPKAKLGWLCCQQYWAEVSPSGEVMRSAFKEMPSPYKEHVESVVLVYLDDRIVPANMQWRSTKCPAAKVLSDTLALAGVEAWAAISPQHKETLACTAPWMRFYGDVELGPQRTSRKSGLTYRSTVCAVKPTSIPEWRLLKQFCEAESTQKQLDDAAERFSYRLNEVKAKEK